MHPNEIFRAYYLKNKKHYGHYLMHLNKEDDNDLTDIEIISKIIEKDSRNRVITKKEVKDF